MPANQPDDSPIRRINSDFEPLRGIDIERIIIDEMGGLPAEIPAHFVEMLRERESTSQLDPAANDLGDAMEYGCLLSAASQALGRAPRSRSGRNESPYASGGEGRRPETTEMKLRNFSRDIIRRTMMEPSYHMSNPSNAEEFVFHVIEAAYKMGLKEAEEKKTAPKEVLTYSARKELKDEVVSILEDNLLGNEFNQSTIEEIIINIEKL